MISIWYGRIIFCLISHCISPADITHHFSFAVDSEVCLSGPVFNMIHVISWFEAHCCFQCQSQSIQHLAHGGKTTDTQAKHKHSEQTNLKGSYNPVVNV